MNIDINKIRSWAVNWPKEPIGDAVSEACCENKDVIVLAADLAGAVGVNGCAKYENQFFNLGIMEQNMIGVACGLALEGKIPITTSFAPFLTLRPAEQIRTAVCYMDQNVKFISNNGGLRGGKAGTSHYGLEDLSVLRTFPNMVILSPSDGLSMYKCIKAAVEYKGPVYIRAAGVPEMKIIYDKDFDFEIGKAIKLEQGEDIAILATGSMTAKAIDAVEILKTKGINPTLYDFNTVKPLDENAVIEASSKHKIVVTIEENTVMGGFGSACAEVIAQSDCSCRMKILGIKDKFMKIGPYEKQLSRNGLLPDQIAETIEGSL